MTGPVIGGARHALTTIIGLDDTPGVTPAILGAVIVIDVALDTNGAVTVGSVIFVAAVVGCGDRRERCERESNGSRGEQEFFHVEWWCAAFDARSRDSFTSRESSARVAHVAR